MIVQPRHRPVKLTHGGRTVVIRPHQSIQLPDHLARKVLTQAGGKLRRVKGS